MQIDEIEWNCSKLIETIEVNAVEVQGIWDDEDEILKNKVAMLGILPKGMTELRKRVVDDNVARSGKHYRPSLEKGPSMKPQGRKRKRKKIGL